MEGSFVPKTLWNCEFNYWKLLTHSNCFVRVTLMLPKGQEAGSYHISTNNYRYFHGLKFSWLKKTNQTKTQPKPIQLKKQLPRNSTTKN